MKETLFTKIAKREIPAFIVEENDDFMAFLDIMPSVYAQTLCIPKNWHDPYVFNNEPEAIASLMAFAQNVAKKLDAKLGSERCLVMFEGYGVDHLHAKLYPVFSKDEAFAFSPHTKVEFNEQIAGEILSKLA
jgi:histidine triad (HIT) family protein